MSLNLPRATALAILRAIIASRFEGQIEKFYDFMVRDGQFTQEEIDKRDWRLRRDLGLLDEVAVEPTVMEGNGRVMILRSAAHGWRGPQ